MSAGGDVTIQLEECGYGIYEGVSNVAAVIGPSSTSSIHFHGSGCSCSHFVKPKKREKFNKSRCGDDVDTTEVLFYGVKFRVKSSSRISVEILRKKRCNELFPLLFFFSVPKKQGNFNGWIGQWQIAIPFLCNGQDPTNTGVDIGSFSQGLRQISWKSSIAYLPTSCVCVHIFCQRKSPVYMVAGIKGIEVVENWNCTEAGILRNLGNTNTIISVKTKPFMKERDR